jgi:hypothetical protein
MPTPILFACHPDDVSSGRAGVVATAWCHPSEGAGSLAADASEWLAAARKGDATLRRVIRQRVNRTQVTAVLIGEDTWSQRWVRYEIVRTVEAGHGLLAVSLGGIPDRDGRPGAAGQNPLDRFYFRLDYDEQTLGLWEWHDGSRRWDACEELGPLPLARVPYPVERSEGLLSSIFHSYDWIEDRGPANLPHWVALAARNARRSAV